MTNLNMDAGMIERSPGDTSGWCSLRDERLSIRGCLVEMLSKSRKESSDPPFCDRIMTGKKCLCWIFCPKWTDVALIIILV